MKSKRIAFAILTLAAVLLPLRTRAGGREALSPSDQLEERARAALEQLAAARLRWSALEQRDSAAGWIWRAGDRTPSPSISLSGFPSGAGLMAAESLLIRNLVARAGGNETVRIGVRVYESKWYGPTWWGLYSGNLIIHRDDRTWCVALVAGGQRPDGRIQAGKERLGNALAPCLLLARFGLPGPPLLHWLEDFRYAPARSNEWLTGTSELLWDNGPWAWLPDGSFSAPPERYRRASLSGKLGLEDIVQTLAPPYHYGPSGLRCVAGMRLWCVRAILDPGVLKTAEREIPRDLTLSPLLIRSAAITPMDNRPPGTSFLSDLIQEKGPERFARFWKSTLPLETAFAAAFGESLADWTARWAKQRWLQTSEARYRSPVVLLGVTLNPSGVFLAVAWGVLAVAVAGWLAARRTVTV